MEYEEIKKIIESCHLNFLIGSGASKPFLGTLGNVETLLTELSKKKESDKKNIVDASIKKHYFNVAIKGNLRIGKGRAEKLLKTKQSYVDFLTSINTILSKRKSNLVSKQANVFTTNMDLFLEYALEEQKLAFNDGFYGRLKPTFGTENFHNTIRKTSTHYEYQSEVPLFNIFKMHGSVNWKESNGEIIFDYGLGVLRNISKLEFPENTLLQINDKDGKSKTVDQLCEEDIEKNGIHEEFIEAYNKILMITPTKQKFETTTLDVTFYELLRMYSNYLERENSALFVFGFSFADEHIREITKRVAASNPTLLILIFAFDKEAKGNIAKEIHETQNIKIICPNEDDTEYSLDEINKSYFVKLANDLTNVVPSKQKHRKSKDDAKA